MGGRFRRLMRMWGHNHRYGPGSCWCRHGGSGNGSAGASALVRVGCRIAAQALDGARSSRASASSDRSRGRPTLNDLEDRVRRGDPDASLGLLAIERRDRGDVIGYCGLIANDHGQDGEPEMAYELLRAVWGQGYATEASLAVVSWAKELGYRRLWATVREWNTASRRVLVKLGFVETARVKRHPIHGNSLFYIMDFSGANGTASVNGRDAPQRSGSSQMQSRASS
ncbi:GNAT family N-acetyltransferase [Arthrobacter sp. PL16]|uniref:GNAT family N-acetyltransferase n=1 Tax=Arthrobacter sp. PL16 TaxID=3071720 RepID=UPI002E15C8DE